MSSNLWFRQENLHVPINEVTHFSTSRSSYFKGAPQNRTENQGLLPSTLYIYWYLRKTRERTDRQKFKIWNQHALEINDRNNLCKKFKREWKKPHEERRHHDHLKMNNRHFLIHSVSKHLQVTKGSKWELMGWIRPITMFCLAIPWADTFAFNVIISKHFKIRFHT